MIGIYYFAGKSMLARILVKGYSNSSSMSRGSLALHNVELPKEVDNDEIS